VVALFALCAALCLAADQQQPVFYFGGQRLFAGMTKSEAVARLSACCKLSPPADSENEKLSADTDRRIGHFISSKQESPQRIIGTIFFANGKVVRITRPLDESINSQSDDAVALARALDRSLLPDTSDSSTEVLISTRHERMGNGESEVLSFSFPNGRAIELEIVTLDTATKDTGKRDAVGLDEVLVAPRQ